MGDGQGRMAKEMDQRIVANDRVECDQGGGTFGGVYEIMFRRWVSRKECRFRCTDMLSRGAKSMGIWSENVRTEAQPKIKMDEMRNNPRELVQRT